MPDPTVQQPVMTKTYMQAGVGKRPWALQEAKTETDETYHVARKGQEQLDDAVLRQQLEQARQLRQEDERRNTQQATT